MREQTITWYTPEEIMPDDDRLIMWIDIDDECKYIGYLDRENFVDGRYLSYEVKEWCYIDDIK